LRALSIVPYSEGWNVSEAVFVSILRVNGWGTVYWVQFLRLVLSNGHNKVGVYHLFYYYNYIELQMGGPTVRHHFTSLLRKVGAYLCSVWRCWSLWWSGRRAGTGSRSWRKERRSWGPPLPGPSARHSPSRHFAGHVTRTRVDSLVHWPGTAVSYVVTQSTLDRARRFGGTPK
jgi:hypothetical protein